LKINYYHILGVQKSSSEAEIKAAYKTLAKKYHPDKNSNNLEFEEKFKQINEAYQTLSNSTKKKNYDWETYKYSNDVNTPKYHYNTSYTTNYHRNFSFGQFQQKEDPTKNQYRRNPQKGNVKFYILTFLMLVTIIVLGLFLGKSINN
jgi:DnaJ-class molecular chaperone